MHDALGLSDEARFNWIRPISRVLILTLACTLAACGGGNSSSDSTTPPSGQNPPVTPPQSDPPTNNDPPTQNPPADDPTDPPDNDDPPAVPGSPTIVTQPQAQSVMLGETATFAVAATSDGTLSYQWKKNNVDISGATSPTWITPPVTADDSGAAITVVVSSNDLKVTSNAATLAVHADPQGLYYGSATIGGTTSPVYAMLLKDGTSALFAKTGEFAPGVPLGRVFAADKFLPTVFTFNQPFTAYLQLGDVFADGSTQLTGTLTGELAPGSRITGTITSTLDTATYEVEYLAAEYERPASGALIAGTYHYKGKLDATVVDGTLVFAADGTFTMSDSAGCSGTGTYSIPDAERNAYRFLGNETCPWGHFTFTGLQAYFPAGTGAAINDNVAFATDTLVISVTDGESGNMLFATK
jgi:hypothetical protein